MHGLYLLALDHDIHEVLKTNLVCYLCYFIPLIDLDTWWQRYTKDICFQLPIITCIFCKSELCKCLFSTPVKIDLCDLSALHSLQPVWQVKCILNLLLLVNLLYL